MDGLPRISGRWFAKDHTQMFEAPRADDPIEGNEGCRLFYEQLACQSECEKNLWLRAEIHPTR